MSDPHVSRTHVPLTLVPEALVDARTMHHVLETAWRQGIESRTLLALDTGNMLNMLAAKARVPTTLSPAETLLHPASLAVWLHALKDEAPKDAIGKFFLIASAEQQALMKAFLALKNESRSVLGAFVPARVDEHAWLAVWRQTCVGAIAAATVAKSVIGHGVPCFLPTPEIDAFSCIDLVCGSLETRDTGLCLQIKAATRNGVTPMFQCPTEATASPGLFREQLRLWNGTQKYNGAYGRQCRPAFVTVRMTSIIGNLEATDLDQRLRDVIRPLRQIPVTATP